MENSIPFFTVFWLLVPNLLIVLLSLIRLIRAETGDDR